jgi:hypothetical protein
LIILITFSEEYKLWSSSLCNFSTLSLHPSSEFQLYLHIKTPKLKLMHLNVAILADILLCYFHWFCRLLLNLMALVIVAQILTKLLRGQSKLLCETICKWNCSRPLSDCGFGQF